MPVVQLDGDRGWRRHTRAQRRIRFLLTLGVTAALVVAWKSISSQTTWSFVLDAGVQLRDMGMRMFPPDGGYVTALARPMIDTVHMAKSTLGKKY